MRKLFLALLLAIGCSGCVSQIKPIPQPQTFPAGTNVYDNPVVAEYKAPDIYEKWWQELQECEQMSISRPAQDRIHYYYVMGEYFHMDYFHTYRDTSQIIGFANIWLDRLYVIKDGVTREGLVKHEMLHFLMWHNGWQVGHPRELFDKCGVT